MLAAVLAVFILAHEDCRSSRSIPPQNSSPDMQTVLEGLFACEIQRRKPCAKSANVFLLVLLQTLQDWSITCGSGTLIEMNRLVYVSIVFLIFGQRYQWDPVGLAVCVPDVTNAKHATLAVGPSCGISSERGGYGLGTLRVPCRSSSRRDLTRFMSLQCFLSLKLTIYRIYRTPWLSLTMRSFMVLPDDLSFQDFQAAIWSV